MKKPLILPLLFLAFNALFAQQSSFNNPLLEKDYLFDTSNGFPKDNPDKNVRGTRFSTEEYVEGQLIMKNGNRYSTGLTFKFDEYFNGIQVKFSNGKESVIFYNAVDSFRLFVGKNVVHYVKADVPNQSEINMFYQAIYQSPNYQLIKLPKKTIVSVDTRDVFGEGEQFKKFENKDIYFFKKGTGKAFEKVKISKKTLVELLPNKKENLNKLFDTPQYKGTLDDAKLAMLLKEIDF